MTASPIGEGRPRATWMPPDLARFPILAGRYWKLLLLSVVAGVIAMFGALLVVSPSYEISAKLLLHVGREMAAPPVLGAKVGAEVMPASIRPEDTESEVEILSNPGLIERVVEHFGEAFFFAEPAPPDTLWQQIKSIPKGASRWVRDTARETLVLVGVRPPTTPLERAVLAVGAALRVEAVRKSDVIEIKLAYPDRQAGLLLLQQYIDYALGTHVQARRSQGVSEFFSAERQDVSQQLRRAEERLLSVRTERTAVWSAPEQRTLLLKAEADLLQQHAQALVEAAQAEAEIESARAVLKTLPDQVKLSSVQARSRMSGDLRTRVVQLEAELANLKTRYAENSREVSGVQRQIEVLRRSIAAEPAYNVDGVTTGANQQYEALARDQLTKQNLLEGQRARANEIDEQLRQLRVKLRVMQAAEIEIAELERNVARLRHTLELYEKGLDDARIAEAMDVAKLSNLTVIMPPTAEVLPSYPSVRRFLILGFVGGLSLGVGFILTREMLWREPTEREEGTEDIEAT